MSSTDMDIEASEENVTKTSEPSSTVDSLEEDMEVSVKCPPISDPSPINSFDVRMQNAENHTSYDKLAKLNRRSTHNQGSTCQDLTGTYKDSTTTKHWLGKGVDKPLQYSLSTTFQLCNRSH